MDIAEKNGIHRRFAAEYFNETWELLENLSDDPTPQQRDALILTAGASLFHWTQREDVTPKNLSVGAWLLSRTYAVVNRTSEALYWARRSLDHAVEAKASPFYVGYAHEATARAELGSDPDEARAALERAEKAAAKVEDPDHRAQLQKDLQEIREQLS